MQVSFNDGDYLLLSGKFLSIVLSLAMWVSCVNGHEHWDQFFPSFFLASGRSANGYLSFEISYAFASHVELDMATTFSPDEKFKNSPLVSAHPKLSAHQMAP